MGFPKGSAAIDFGRVLLTASEPASILEGVRNAYFAVRRTAEEDCLMSVAELQRQMDACKKDLTCRANVERFFISTGGKVTVQAGGKVFVDQTGGKVFIPNP
jgi:hypothetical protein